MAKRYRKVKNWLGDTEWEEYDTNNESGCFGPIFILDFIICIICEFFSSCFGLNDTTSVNNELSAANNYGVKTYYPSEYYNSNDLSSNDLNSNTNLLYETISRFNISFACPNTFNIIQDSNNTFVALSSDEKARLGVTYTEITNNNFSIVGLKNAYLKECGGMLEYTYIGQDYFRFKINSNGLSYHLYGRHINDRLYLFEFVNESALDNTYISIIEYIQNSFTF